MLMRLGKIITQTPTIHVYPVQLRTHADASRLISLPVNRHVYRLQPTTLAPRYYPGFRSCCIIGQSSDGILLRLLIQSNTLEERNLGNTKPYIGLSVRIRTHSPALT